MNGRWSYDDRRAEEHERLVRKAVQDLDPAGLPVLPMPPSYYRPDLWIDLHWVVEVKPMNQRYGNIAPHIGQWHYQVETAPEYGYSALFAWEEDGVLWAASPDDLRPRFLSRMPGYPNFLLFHVAGWKPARLFDLVTADKRFAVSVPAELSPATAMQLNLAGGEEPMAATRWLGVSQRLALTWMRDGFRPYPWQIGVVMHSFGSTTCGDHPRDLRGVYEGDACCRTAADHMSDVGVRMGKAGLVWKSEKAEGGDGRWRLRGQDRRDDEDHREWDARVDDLVRWNRARYDERHGFAVAPDLSRFVLELFDPVPAA